MLDLVSSDPAEARGLRTSCRRCQTIKRHFVSLPTSSPVIPRGPGPRPVGAIHSVYKPHVYAAVRDPSGRQQIRRVDLPPECDGTDDCALRPAPNGSGGLRTPFRVDVHDEGAVVAGAGRDEEVGVVGMFPSPAV